MEILKDVLLLMVGGLIGVTVMGLMQVSADADRKMEKWKGK